MDIPEEKIGEILDKNPSRETLYILLPMLMKEGNPDLVIRECLKSLDRFPEDYTIRKILAETYFADGKHHEAEAEIDTVINNLERAADSYRLKADILMSMKREIEAADCLERYVVLCPEDEMALHLLNSIRNSMEKAAEEIPEVNEGYTDQRAAEDKKRKKERLIKILDSWRSSFQEGGSGESVNDEKQSWF